MSNLQDEQAQLKELELETIVTDHHISMGEDLNWLRNTPQFKRVVMEGYLRDKALDSVSMLADPNVIKNGERALIMEDLVASSNLAYFFMMVDNQYAGALNSVEDFEEGEE